MNVTFDLLDGTYKLNKKPNDQLLYVNTSSKDPPQIIKQLPTSICNRLSNNSSKKQLFDTSKGEYEKALRESGYRHKKEKNKNKITPKTSFVSIHLLVKMFPPTQLNDFLI